MTLGKLDIPMQKDENGLLSHIQKSTHTKIGSKWIKTLNIRPESIKLLEENIEKKLLGVNLGSNIFGYDSKSQATKAKIDKWNYNKLRSFCVAKETTDRVHRQLIEWEEIFGALLSI